MVNKVFNFNENNIESGLGQSLRFFLKNYLKSVFISVLIGGVFLFFTPQVFAESEGASKVDREVDKEKETESEDEKTVFEEIVIDEIQTGSDKSAGHDFVRLYNESEEDLSLKSCSIRKIIKSGKESSVAALSSKYSIKAKDYFIWANKENGFAEEMEADISNKNRITNGDCVLLVCEKELIDKVCDVAESDSVAENKEEDEEKVEEEIKNKEKEDSEEDGDPENESSNNKSGNDSNESSGIGSGEVVEVETEEVKIETEEEKSGEVVAEGGEVIEIEDEEAVNDNNSNEAENNEAEIEIKEVVEEVVEIEEVKEEDSGENEKDNENIDNDNKGGISGDALIEVKENIETEVEQDYSGKILLNEILPNATGRDKNNEWIELLNISEEEIDLTNWYFENNYKRPKKFQINEVKIEVGEIVLIRIQNSSFSIRNSREKIKLFDFRGNLVDEVVIVGYAKPGVSYNRLGDGEWSWSNRVTPGEKNRLNAKPVIVIKKPKRLYKNIYAKFDASKTFDTDGEKLSFRWDFGDGRRSYKKRTYHRYLEKGDYEVTLTVSDGSSSVVESFMVKVESYPRRDVEIVKIVPNPSGKDRGEELIVLRNNSSKKINLRGWKIATGRNKKSLISHPIYDDIFIKPGKEEEIFNDESCFFSLLNKKGRIHLIYPDGQRADKLKYQKAKIENDEAYVMKEGVWRWVIDDELEIESGVNVDFESDNKSSIMGEASRFYGESDLVGGVGDVEIKFQDLWIGMGTSGGAFGNRSSYLDRVLENDSSRQCVGFSQLRVENWRVKNINWLRLL